MFDGQTVPAQTYTFTGTGITSLELDGNEFHSAGTSGDVIDNLTMTTAAVPEPSTLALCAIGLSLVGYAARRRIRDAASSFGQCDDGVH